MTQNNTNKQTENAQNNLSKFYSIIFLIETIKYVNN